MNHYRILQKTEGFWLQKCVYLKNNSGRFACCLPPSGEWENIYFCKTLKAARKKKKQLELSLNGIIVE